MKSAKNSLIIPIYQILSEYSITNVAGADHQKKYGKK